MPFEWIDYNQTKVLYIDYRSCTDASEMIMLLEEGMRIEAQNPGILEIADFTGISIPLDYIDAVTRAGEKHRKTFIGKTAVLGISGIKKFLYKTYIKTTGEKDIDLFKTVEDALEWLTEEQTQEDFEEYLDTELEEVQ